jgi:ATP-dependent DNA helicase RecQ
VYDEGVETFFFYFRGEAGRDDEPFRVWYGRLSEARSLIKCPVLLITATANKSARRKIQKKFAMHDCCELIDNPDRPNIKLFVQKYKRTVPIESVLEQLIYLVNEKQELCDRYIVFCPSIALCSKVFTAFRLEIGNKKIKHVEMYHSKTTDQTKEKIRKDLNDPSGQVRILVATSAAGMGVNFVGVNYVINFGPPKDMDSFVQQVGRCGRDGTQAMAMLIFNKAQCRGLDSEMKDYVNNKSSCRRQLILKTYNAKSPELKKHLCCDICESYCDCKSDQCKTFDFPIVISEHDPEEVYSDTECDERINSSSSNVSESDTE